jgi:amino acid adenylation domain-containing protein
VPIDEEMPAARIELILDNVRSPLIICDDDTYAIAKTFPLKTERLVLYEEIKDTQPDEDAISSIRLKAIDTDPIYIVFTSGSTGVPKGVVACHRSVIDYIEQLSEILSFSSETVFGNQSPLYFDACLKELYPTLKFGATTYLISRRLFSLPIELIKFLNEHKINTICWVVSALTIVSSLGTFKTIKPLHLHTIAFGSEVFPIKQLKIWRETLPNAHFTNLYGPTETTGMCCFYNVTDEYPGDGIIPIGRPFPNREILLLKDDLTLAKKGETGEIYVRGNAVTPGYYNDPGRTAEAFVQNPLNKSYPEIVYKTGDIGRYNESGELVFVSRKDFQIKHMGHRIELGEIEVSVNMLPEISMAACIYDPQKTRIILYFTGDIAEPELMVALKERLPQYMLPNRIIKLETMPFTPNGKIDRMALRATYENR